MDINQFAVYQLKNGPETRQMRFRSYEKLQQSGIQVRYEYYREVYLGKMQRQDTPENIRERLQKKIPKEVIFLLPQSPHSILIVLIHVHPLQQNQIIAPKLYLLHHSM